MGAIGVTHEKAFVKRAKNGEVYPIVKTMERVYQKIYEAYPLCCPNCSGEMKIISFNTGQQVIRQTLKHLSLWTQMPSRDPPNLYLTHRQMFSPIMMDPV